MGVLDLILATSGCPAPSCPSWGLKQDDMFCRACSASSSNISLTIDTIASVARAGALNVSVKPNRMFKGLHVTRQILIVQNPLR